MTSTTDPVTLVKQKYEGLRRDMIRWRDSGVHLQPAAHKKRWNRALAALGEITGEPALTSLEAQAYSDRGWKRWDRVVIAIREMEQAVGNLKQAYQQAAKINTKLTTKPAPKVSTSNAPDYKADLKKADSMIHNLKQELRLQEADLKKADSMIHNLKQELRLKDEEISKPKSSGRTSNAPDYKADYKDACRVINDLRAELSKTKQEKNTARQRLASAEKYGTRQHERAEKLESQVKTAGSVSDAAYNKLVDDYENMRDLCAKQKNELYQLQGRKITFAQAVKAVMDDKIINKEIPTEGAKHLTSEDRRELSFHIEHVNIAMNHINTWLWDVNSVPPGQIGKRYVGKNYNQDMAEMLKLIDHITHQAWQTMQVVRELGRKMKATK